MQVASSSGSNLSRAQIHELVRSAALREAAARLEAAHLQDQHPDPDPSNSTQDQPQSSTSISQFNPTEANKNRSADLLEAFEIEKAKNDAMWTEIQQVSEIRRRIRFKESSCMLPDGRLETEVTLLEARNSSNCA